MEDGKIIQLYLDRDESAIRQTQEKYGARLRGIAYGITLDAETSEECENDTYLEAWGRIPPSEPRSYFFAFLARIIRSAAIDRCRAKLALKRSGYIVSLTDELASCLPSPVLVEDITDAKLLGETISRFLRTLPEEKQVIFLRRYFYLDPVSEISRRLSVSESKVKTTLFRIRNDLRSYLMKEWDMP